MPLNRPARGAHGLKLAKPRDWVERRSRARYWARIFGAFRAVGRQIIADDKAKKRKKKGKR